MEILKIDNNDVIEIIGNGNQRKFFYENYWYKMDDNGYEGLCEVICSRLSKKYYSRLEYVEYEPCIIGNQTGCRSTDIRKSNYSLISLSDIITESAKNMDLSYIVDYLMKKVKEITHIIDFCDLFMDLLYFDMIIANVDRNMNNILFYYSGINDEYKMAPILDFAASCGFEKNCLAQPLKIPHDEQYYLFKQYYSHKSYLEGGEIYIVSAQ